MEVRLADLCAGVFGSWGFNKAFMRNYLAHMNLEDSEMRDIVDPWSEMQLHICYKFGQAFSIVGLGIGLVVARKPNKLRKMGQAAFLGTVLGAGLAAPAAWHFRSQSLAQEDIYVWSLRNG